MDRTSRTHWRAGPDLRHGAATAEEPSHGLFPVQAHRRAAISCRSRARPTCPTACCAPWTTRPWTIAARISACSARQLLEKVKPVFKTKGHVVIYPASGTGAWEAALANTLSPGDRVLMCETGWFAHLWQEMADRLGIVTDLRQAPTGAAAPTSRQIEARLRDGQGPRHQGRLRRPQRDLAPAAPPASTRSAAPSTPPATRRCCWSTPSPRSARMDYRHDEWGVDVTVSGSQKGLMLPPGLSFNAISRQGAEGERDGEAAAQPSGTGSRCSRPTPPATSPTRRRPTCSTASMPRSTCCSRKGSTTSSPATTASPKPRAAPCATGASRSSAPSRGTIPPC